MSLRIAITGARGRLAPLIARSLESSGCKVSLFSRQGGDTIRSLDELVVPVVWNNFDTVIHCGWSCVPLTAEQDPDFSRRHDLPLLRRLLEAGSRPHFIFLSTGAVYGDTGEQPAEENSPPDPLGAYARIKLEAEDTIAASSLPWSILRVTNLLGEKPDPERPQGILPRLIHAARTGEEVVLWGDGTATKDYLHCDDFLSALGQVVTDRLCGLFNVSSGESVSLRDLVEMVAAISGRKLRIRHQDHYSWDVSFSRISSRKLRDLTGWSSRMDVRHAVADCYAHFS